MKQNILSICAVILCLLMLTGCTLPEDQRFVNPTEYVPWEPTEPTATEETKPQPKPTEAPAKLTAAQIAAELSDEQLIAQLFLVKCPYGGAQELLDAHHVGGIILYDQDIDGETPESLKAKLTDCQSRVPIPLLVAVDEEGGTINRISSHAAFRKEAFRSPHDLYYEGGLKLLRETETEKAQLLRRVGINVNLSPVCDVVSKDDAYMADRSLFQTAKTTGEAVAAMVKSMQQNGVGAVLKHFPGFGDLSGDDHTGKVVDNVRSPEHLRAYDYVPFRKGIEADAGAVMVGHCLVTKLDPSAPASLSEKVVRVLRSDFGFKGVIMTDDLTQPVISEYCDEGEAAVQAILAGCDMIVTSWSDVQYDAIAQALENGRLTRTRLQESAVRIIQWKMDLGLL